MTPGFKVYARVRAISNQKWLFFGGDGIRAENPFLSFVKSCDMQTK